MTRARGRMLTTVERIELVECVLVRRLGCGCQVGLYRTMSGRALTIVDTPDDDCPDRGHQADFVIEARDMGMRADAMSPSHGEAA